MMRARFLSVALVLSALMVALVAVPTPARADAVLLLTWPEVHRFNPDQTSYAVRARYAGTGTVWLTGAGDGAQQLIVGEFTDVVFGEDGYRTLTGWRCPAATFDETACVAATTQRNWVETYRRLHVSSHSVAGPSGGPWIGVLPSAPVSPATGWVGWDVVPVEASDESPLLSGGHAFTGNPTTEIGPNDVLVDGREYLFRARVTRDDPTYGRLEGQSEDVFRWDSSVAATLSMSNDKFWPGSGSPVRDVELVLDIAPEDSIRFARIQVWDVAAGESIWEWTRQPSGQVRRVSTEWRGTPEFSSRVVPPGVYEVRAEVYDSVGNLATVTRPIEVGGHHTETWRKTFRAAPTVDRIETGRCAAVFRPARRSWPGSVAYRTSHTACDRLPGWSAITYSSARIPAFPRWSYKDVRLNVFGGKPPGPDSGYLQLWLRARSGRYAAGVSAPSWLGAHPGPSVEGTQALLGDVGDSPYVSWKARSIAEGGYDVKSFTIKVRHVVLD